MDGCWSGIDDGCEVELGAVLGAVLGEAGVLCAIAKPLPNATINASLFKFLTSVLRFPFSRFGPLGNRYAYTKDERRSSRNRGQLWRYKNLDAPLNGELAHQIGIRELLKYPRSERFLLLPEAF